MPTAHHDDLELVRAALAGDQTAFTTLTRKYESRLHAWVHKQFRGNSAQEVDDVVQDILLKVWRGLDSWDPGRAAFSTWLYRITLNRAVDVLRARSKGPKIDAILDMDADPGGAEDVFADEAPAPIDCLIKDEANKEMLGAIAKLDERYRVPITLHHMHDLEYVEIADRLGAPMETVKSRLARGRQQLRVLLDPYWRCSDLAGDAEFEDAGPAAG